VALIESPAALNALDPHDNSQDKETRDEHVCDCRYPDCEPTSDPRRRANQSLRHDDHVLARSIRKISSMAVRLRHNALAPAPAIAIAIAIGKGMA
jgi:hypothetical protein